MYTSLIPAKGFKARFKNGGDEAGDGGPWETPVIAWATSDHGYVSPLIFCGDTLEDPRMNSCGNFDCIVQEDS